MQTPCFFADLNFFRNGMMDEKDVMIITGRKPRAAWKRLAKISKKYRKEKDQFVTVSEFSAFTGIYEESIFSTIN